MYIIAKAAVHERSGALRKRRVAARFAAPLSRPGSEAIPGGGTSYILRVCICMAAWRHLYLDDSECVSKFGRAQLTGLAVWTSAWTRRAVDGLGFAPVPYTTLSYSMCCSTRCVIPEGLACQG